MFYNVRFVLAGATFCFFVRVWITLVINISTKEKMCGLMRLFGRHTD